MSAVVTNTTDQIMEAVSAAKEGVLVMSNGKGSSGAVSVTSPDTECKTNEESCFSAKPL